MDEKEMPNTTTTSQRRARWLSIFRAAQRHPWGVAECHPTTGAALARRGWATRQGRYVKFTNLGRIQLGAC